MQIRWYGQSAFSLTDGDRTVFIDPFGDMSGAAARGIEFNYPAIEGAGADLLLITHEHGDHNAAEVISGEPDVIRSTAGTFGDVVGIASEHDDAAGTLRGPNTIFVFTLGGARVAHFGDFGQPALRPAQRAAIGDVDILFLPVGGGPTVGGEAAAQIVRELAPRVIVPMHYRSAAVNFLDPPDAFVEAVGGATRADSSEFDPEGHEGVVLLAPPILEAAAG
jgi:L-ascorbate metabolism protein UlaG (beta-lactamase superfamily)